MSERWNATLIKAAGWLGLAALGLTASSAWADQPKRPNVLFIAIDDLRPEFGAYGATQIQSPNLDRFASQGVRFDRAYCQYALCAPSRISLLTGLAPDALGLYDYRNDPGHDAYVRVEGQTLTLPEHFKQQGYNTLTVGKIFHLAEGPAHAWTDARKAPASLYPDPQVTQDIRRREQQAKQEGLKGVKLQKAISGPATLAYDAPDEQFKDGSIAKVAMELLDEYGHRDQPFFLAVGFIRPHLPFVAPQSDWDRYDRAAITVPSADEPTHMSRFALVESWNDVRNYRDIPNQGNLKDAKAREMIHGYYACVSHVDRQVGKLLDQLETMGLADNTVVVLWGDHGWKLGDYGDWAKSTNMEYDARVPLVIRSPGVRGGVSSGSLVELLDLFPTLTELCGLPTPENLDGRSLVPVLADPSTSVREGAISQYARYPGQFNASVMGYSIRTEQYRYTEWRDRVTAEVVDRELYDHADGPLATANLADERSYQPIVDRHAELLRNSGRTLQPAAPAKSTGKQAQPSNNAEPE